MDARDSTDVCVYVCGAGGCMRGGKRERARRQVDATQQLVVRSMSAALLKCDAAAAAVAVVARERDALRGEAAALRRAAAEAEARAAAARREIEQRAEDTHVLGIKVGQCRAGANGAVTRTDGSEGGLGVRR